jgi:hypothetical protein
MGRMSRPLKPESPSSRNGSDSLFDHIDYRRIKTLRLWVGIVQFLPHTGQAQFERLKLLGLWNCGFPCANL